jgi:hypothetical protein
VAYGTTENKMGPSGIGTGRQQEERKEQARNKKRRIAVRNERWRLLVHQPV